MRVEPCFGATVMLECGPSLVPVSEGATHAPSLSRPLSSIVTVIMVATGTVATSSTELASATPISASAPKHETLGGVLPSRAELEAEIDRVVNKVQPVPMGASPLQQAQSVVRCAEFLPHARYCLTFGWTSKTKAELQAEFAAALSEEASVDDRAAQARNTGDLTAQNIVAGAATQTGPARRSADRRELTDAANSIAAYLRIESVESSLATQKFPNRGKILKNRVNDQRASNWCGPTAMQMIHWNWGDNNRTSQKKWANRLGTGPKGGAGTAITSMVRVMNQFASGWVYRQDKRYITLDISDKSYRAWFRLNVNHYSTWRTPVILHPVLKKKWYPYMPWDGVGHFQVGRGWDFERDNTAGWKLGYYEPYNPQRFYPNQAFVKRKQWRWAKNSYWANQAHFQHNIGV